jgi:hypothetical protein
VNRYALTLIIYQVTNLDTFNTLVKGKNLTISPSVVAPSNDT